MTALRANFGETLARMEEYLWTKARDFTFQELDDCAAKISNMAVGVGVFRLSSFCDSKLVWFGLSSGWRDAKGGRVEF